MKHIPIKVLTRLQEPFEKYHLRHLKVLKIPNIKSISCKEYTELEQLELIDGKVYNVSWLNKHDTSLDEIFNNPLDQLESLSIR